MATPQPIRLTPTRRSSDAQGVDSAVPEMQAILEAIGAGERFLVCSHSRPDGDAIGSMLAMGMLLRQMGKRVDLVAADRLPAVYRGLPGAEQIRTAMRVHGLYDAVILTAWNARGCAGWSGCFTSTSITTLPARCLANSTGSITMHVP
jgi:hypothetical protein